MIVNPPPLFPSPLNATPSHQVLRNPSKIPFRPGYPSPWRNPRGLLALSHLLVDFPSMQIRPWVLQLTKSSLVTRENKELEKLSSLGHFLKGSSATLGLVKVRDNCEKIQRFGKKEKEDGSPLLDEKVCLEKIAETLKTLETDYADVEQVLKQYFEGRAAAD